MTVFFFRIGRNNMSYRIVPQLLPIDDRIRRTIEDLVHTKGSYIFNPDRKRWQTQLKPSHPFHRQFATALEHLGVVRGRTIGPMFALHSKAGCKQQQWHYDYDPALVESVRKKPCGVVLALEDGTTLSIYGEGDVALKAGDCLIFDGDCVHAGSKYEKANTRVHVYLDVPTIDRRLNRTWFFQEKNLSP